MAKKETEKTKIHAQNADTFFLSLIKSYCVFLFVFDRCVCDSRLIISGNKKGYFTNVEKCMKKADLENMKPRRALQGNCYYMGDLEGLFRFSIIGARCELIRSDTHVARRLNRIHFDCQCPF